MMALPAVCSKPASWVFIQIRETLPADDESECGSQAPRRVRKRHANAAKPRIQLAVGHAVTGAANRFQMRQQGSEVGGKRACVRLVRVGLLAHLKAIRSAGYCVTHG